jgi:Ca-activated chloride channel homolog
MAHKLNNLPFLLFFIFAVALGAFAQSGRKKPAENQGRAPQQRPSIELPPIRVADKKPAPTPTPPPAETTKENTKPNESGEETDEEILRVESTLIPIPASVTDERGFPVRNLKQSDFELRVDGAVQEISELWRAETPIRLALLFDNSSSVSVAREFEKKAAIKFLRKVLRPERDKAALYSVSTIARLEQKLTADVRQLINTIETFPPPEGATALLDAVIKAADYLDETATDGRRVIVIVSDGADTISDSTLEQTIRAAQIANCQVYVVKTTDFENFQRTGRRGGSENLRDLAAERRMQQITEQTGGAVYSPLDEREVETAFARIAAELSEQYVLSYYPSDTTRDGRLRQIALRVPAKQNLTVRTRKGYYVPKL